MLAGLPTTQGFLSRSMRLQFHVPKVTELHRRTEGHQSPNFHLAGMTWCALHTC